MGPRNMYSSHTSFSDLDALIAEEDDTELETLEQFEFSDVELEDDIDEQIYGSLIDP